MIGKEIEYKEYVEQGLYRELQGAVKKATIIDKYRDRIVDYYLIKDENGLISSIKPFQVIKIKTI